LILKEKINKVMKKIFVIILVMLSCVVEAQDGSVEKSIYGIQIGGVGIWGHNELRFSDQIAIRTELGVYTEIQQGIGYYIAPELSISPRWYYNTKKRNQKKLDIGGNSANFLSLKAGFRSNVFEFSDYEYDRAQNSISVSAKWGIKRNLSEKINFEIGSGLGIRSFIGGSLSDEGDSSEAFIDLHIRIGLKL